jgi:hypothetical protein
MTRLALVLAAAVLGTGCVVVHDDTACDRTVTIDWAFQNADGAVTASCAGAGVQLVDVWVNGGVVTFDCFGPPGTVLLAPGANVITVEGIDAQNRIAYREDFSFDASSCGDHGTIATTPAEGRINLDYTVSTSPPCLNGACFVWFSVWDDIAGQVAATVNASVQPTSFPYPDDLVFRLPVGSYTVQFIDVVSGGFAERCSSANPATFDVTPGAFLNQVQLVPAAGPVGLSAACI